jgi:hypothetical protein
MIVDLLDRLKQVNEDRVEQRAEEYVEQMNPYFVSHVARGLAKSVYVAGWKDACAATVNALFRGAK